MSYKADRVNQFVERINERFAVMQDGPHTGKIIDTSTHLPISATQLNQYFARDIRILGDVPGRKPRSISAMWLEHPYRREITVSELAAEL